MFNPTLTQIWARRTWAVIIIILYRLHGQWYSYLTQQFIQIITNLKQMKQRLSLGSTGQAIVLSNQEFSEFGFALGQKTALIPIDPTMDGTQVLTEAAKHKWEIYGQANLQGFASARVERPLTEDELASQIEVGRSIITDFTPSEKESRDVIQSAPSTQSRVGAPLSVDARPKATAENK
jgi:hypothetical protein